MVRKPVPLEFSTEPENCLHLVRATWEEIQKVPIDFRSFIVPGVYKWIKENTTSGDVEIVIEEFVDTVKVSVYVVFESEEEAFQYTLRWA